MENQRGEEKCNPWGVASAVNQFDPNGLADRLCGPLDRPNGNRTTEPVSRIRASWFRLVLSAAAMAVLVTSNTEPPSLHHV